MLKLQNILEEYKRRSKIISNEKYNSLLDKFYGNKKDAIEKKQLQFIEVLKT